MNKWKKTNLFEISDSAPKSFVDGDWIESPYITDEGVRLIQTGNIGVGHFKNKNKKYISYASFKELNCTEVFAGDILICRLAEPVGRSCIVPNVEEKYITSVDVCILRVSKEHSKEYINQYLNTEFFLKKAELLSGGSTRQRISRTNLGKIAIKAPQLSQQNKIAKILSTCDTVISQTEQAIKKYEAIKQGMMKDLFTRGIDVNTGKLRLSYEAQPDLYKQSESGWIPNDWTTAQLKDYTIKNMYGPRFSANDYDTKGNVRTIRGMDFSKNGNILYKQAPIASLPVSKVSTHLLIEDDVVIVTTADCGLTAVYEEQGFPYIPSAYSVKFRFTKDLNPYFFKYFMQTNFAHRLVNKYVRQGTLGNLPGSDILIFKIIVPHFDEQKRIVEKLDFISYKIRTEQETLKKYQQIKAGLMQDLLTGKVQVQTDDAA